MTNTFSDNNVKEIMPVWGRILLVLFAFLIIAGVFQLIGSLISGVYNAVSLETGSSSTKNMSVGQHVVVQLSGLLGVLLIVFGFRKYIDRKTIKSLGFSFKGRCKDICWGLILPLVIICAGTFLLYKLGYISLSSNENDIYSLVLSFVLFIIVALSEEILFRGYILNNLMSVMNKYLALVYSALIFALFHGMNPNMSLLAFGDLFVAGLLLGISYIYTKNLWFPISFHLFWNFIQGPILGYQVSGQKGYSLFNLKTYGDTLYSGGEFGFEGSVFCTLLSLFSLMLIILYFTKLRRVKYEY